MCEGICTHAARNSDDEGNVYVGVDDEVVCEAGDDDDDVVVVHGEGGGLGNGEGDLHHRRKVQVKVEVAGICKLLLGAAWCLTS